MEYVDILLPPDFRKSGLTKLKEEAWRDGSWIGAFNLWIIQDGPNPAMVYQRRSLAASWEPGKLDVAAGGHLTAGEEGIDGLREAREELGLDLRPEDLVYAGKKLGVTLDAAGVERHMVIDIYLVLDATPLARYALQEEEVSAVFSCPLADLIKAHTVPGYSFEAHGVNAAGEEVSLTVTKDSFPYNADSYQFKMVLLAKRLLDGDPYIIY